MRLEEVRKRVIAWAQQQQFPCDLLEESILVENDCYVGQRFFFGQVTATWLCQENTLEFREQARLLERLALPAAPGKPDESAASAPALPGNTAEKGAMHRADTLTAAVQRESAQRDLTQRDAA